MSNINMHNKQSLSQNRKSFNKLYKEIRDKLKPLDNVEIKAYAAHFYQYLELHQKYIKEGTYNEFWKIFRALKEGKISGVPKLKADAKAGGNIAGGARRKLEKRLGRSIVSNKNYLPKKTKMLNK